MTKQSLRFMCTKNMLSKKNFADSCKNCVTKINSILDIANLAIKLWYSCQFPKKLLQIFVIILFHRQND